MRAAFALLFAAASTVAFAQAQKAPSAYEPTSGQEGKDVVWVPTPQVVVDKMLDMARVTKNDFVMDLGSGDGRTVITAAKRGARAVGVEYNPDMVELSKRNAEKEGVSDRATFMKVGGTHKLPQGEVTFKQRYQELSGNLVSEGKAYALEGKVRGEDVTFTAGGREYRGRMNGKRFELKS
jgi:protein-L-isoaspartate O-methyltransferase